MTDDEINKAVNDIRFYWSRLEERNKELEAALREIADQAVQDIPHPIRTFAMLEVARTALAGETKDD